jgi:hypothetical protein
MIGVRIREKSLAIELFYEAMITRMKAHRRVPKPSMLQEYWSDLEVVERGGCKVLARPSNDTASAVVHDYALCEWNLRQIQIVAQQKREIGESYSIAEIRCDFDSQRVLEFANDSDLEAASRYEKTAPIAARMISRVTGISVPTVLQYAKRRRINGRNQRDVIRRSLPRR